MTTTTSPTSVDDVLATARAAWDDFTTAALAGQPAIAPFAEYRAALAVANAVDAKAKRGPYKEAVARYEKIATRVNAANLAIESAGIGSGMVSAVPSGPTRTAEQRSTAIRDANRELNSLAVACGATGYVPRSDDDTTMAHLPYFAEKPHAPSPRRPSSNFERDYGRAVASVLDKHFTTAETTAVAAWQQQQ